MMGITFLLLPLFLPAQQMQSFDVETLWKARALQAVENMKKLEASIAKGDKKARCQWVLESAYSRHVDPKYEPTSHREGRSSHFFNIAWTNGDKEDSLFELLFIYDKKKTGKPGKLVLVRVTQLPSAAALDYLIGAEDFMKASSAYISMTDRKLGCSFTIDTRDPFNSLAYHSSEELQPPAQ